MKGVPRSALAPAPRIDADDNVVDPGDERRDRRSQLMTAVDRVMTRDCDAAHSDDETWSSPVLSQSTELLGVSSELFRVSSGMTRPESRP